MLLEKEVVEVEMEKVEAIEVLLELDSSLFPPV